MVAFLTLLTWLPTVIWPMFPRCVGGLVWFTMRYDFLSLVILCVLVSSFLVLAAIISIQLMRTVEVDPNERIAASRLCYYLIVAAFIYVRMIYLWRTMKTNET